MSELAPETLLRRLFDAAVSAAMPDRAVPAHAQTEVLDAVLKVPLVTTELFNFLPIRVIRRCRRHMVTQFQGSIIPYGVSNA